MHERLILFTYCFAGAQGADIPIYCELPFPWTFIGAKAAASNDSSATLAASGASAGTIFSATAIGDSGDPAYIQPTTPVAIDANELVTVTLDYNGSAGTAASGANVIIIGLSGD